MIKLYVLNALSEPFPARCQILNSILETSNHKVNLNFLNFSREKKCLKFKIIILKDLSIAFEIIVNSVFNSNLSNDISDINNNRNINKYDSKTNWPFKISINQLGLEYNCIYSFLNTSSLFWSCLLKLESLNAVFSLPCASLPVINLSYYFTLLRARIASIARM